MSFLNNTQWTQDSLTFLSKHRVQTETIVANTESATVFNLAAIQSAKSQGSGTLHEMYRLASMKHRFKFDLQDEPSSAVRAGRAGQGVPGLEGYYVPWTAGKTFGLRLGAQADFCFTANMTKCAVFVGAGRDGTVVLYHSNFDCPEIDNPSNMPFEQYLQHYAREQRARYVDFYEDMFEVIRLKENSDNLVCFEPDFYCYALGGKQAGVFGRCENDQWTFYYHVWCDKGSPGSKLAAASPVGTGFVISGELWPNTQWPRGVNARRLG